jgi:regulator of sirC expression with transglutaminase-like and TPR domain
LSLTPVYCRPPAFHAFSTAVENAETSAGLFHAAFAIALHERPLADFAHAEKTIDELAQTVHRRVRSESFEARLAHLHDVLFDVVGLHGNIEDYYHPDNSYLSEVLRTRRGIPITLVLIYKCVAERLGIMVHGINAPGHFLAGVEMPGGEVDRAASDRRLMYVDPFFGGGLLNEEEAYARIAAATGQPVIPARELLRPATHRQWLARMLNNLQATFAASGRDRDVYAMQELQQLL